MGNASAVAAPPAPTGRPTSVLRVRRSSRSERGGIANSKKGTAKSLFSIRCAPPTGVPRNDRRAAKGRMHRHGGVVRRHRWRNEAVGQNDNSRVLHARAGGAREV